MLLSKIVTHIFLFSYFTIRNVRFDNEIITFYRVLTNIFSMMSLQSMIQTIPFYIPQKEQNRLTQLFIPQFDYTGYVRFVLKYFFTIPLS